MLFRKHYPELDAVRAAAILLVILFHVNEQIFHLPAGNILGKFFSWGYHGVDLFFTLSGFLIGGQIIEENFKGTFSFKAFYIKRFWRIFPPYYFALVVFIAVYSIGTKNFILLNPAIALDVASHVFYLQDYIRPIILGGLYWSLAVEEQFYMLLPVFLFLIFKYGNKRLFLWLALSVSAGILLKFVLYDASKEWWVSFYVPLHARFDNLMMGVLAAFIFISYNEKIKNNVWKYGLFFSSMLCLGVTFIYGAFDQGYFNTCWQFMLSGLGFSMLILFMVATPLVGRMPFKKPIGLIARYSYSMYLYHTLILTLLINLLVKYLSIENTYYDFILIFIVYFMAVYLISATLYFFIDRPCMNLRNKFLKALREKE